MHDSFLFGVALVMIIHLYKKSVTNKLKIIDIILFILVIVIVFMSVSIIIHEKQVTIKNETENNYRYITVKNVDYSYKSNIKMILFLGIDQDDDHNLGQCDTIDLAIFDRSEKKFKVLALSRDTMCDIKVFDASGNDIGYQKEHLALSYSYGKSKKHGGILASKAVSRILNGIPIVDYASFDLTHLQSLQDIIGDMPVVLDDDYSECDSSWQKGQTIMINRDNVEKFVRSRNKQRDYSNNARTKRQQLYIKTYITQLKEQLENDYQNTINQLYSFYQSIETNVTIKEVDMYAELLTSYQLDETDFYKVPGTNNKSQLHDEYIIDQKQLNQLILQLFYKKD